MPVDYYGVLEINKNATPDQIRDAYRKLAKQYHPDSETGKLDANAAAKFQQIQLAYDTLLDPQKRKDYDKKNAAPSTALQAVKGAANALDAFLDNKRVAHRVDSVAQNLSLRDGGAAMADFFLAKEKTKDKKEDKGTEKKERKSKDRSPLDIAKERLAKGLITADQYNQIKEQLDE